MRISRRSLTLAAAASVPLLGSDLALGQNATPASATFDMASERATELLQYVPGGILDGELSVIWNDFERQIASMRNVAPDATDDELAMMPLWSSGPELLTWAMMLEEFTGYPISSVRQSMQEGQPPDVVMLVELNTDANSLVPFWESAGYEQRDNEDGEFWTIGEEAEVDLQHPIQQSMLSRLNNVAIIGDNVLAYSPYSSLIARIMSTANGDSPNRIAELESNISNLPEDTVNAWMMDGTMVDFGLMIAPQAMTPEQLARIEDILAESDTAVGPMPVIRTLSVGVTAGAAFKEEFHDSEAREFILLQTDGADMAEQAAEVIAWRYENMESLNTGEPHTELLPNLEIEVLSGEFVRVSVPLATPRIILSRMIQGRDVLLFAY